MIDAVFSNTNRLFFLLFNIVNNDATRDAFDKCYMVIDEIKDFNLLIHSKWGYQLCRVGEWGREMFY